MASPRAAFPPGYADENISSRVLIAACLFIVLEIGVVTLRCWARFKYGAKWGFDDYLMAPALLFCLGICAIGIVEIKIAGVGRHLDVLLATDPEAVVNWAKCGYAIEELYCLAVAFPKLSILATYLRIFTERSYRIISYLVGAVIVCAAVAGVITSLASCRPFSARWNLQLYSTNCIDAPRYWQGMSVPNILTDLIMLVLPMPVVWKLQMARKQKLALTVILLLGSIGIVASIIRLTVTFRTTTLSDGTWVSADIATWSLIEPGCYLVASCL
ncbi:hypothetical protein M406DRAFT_231609, partial [Cryphonectria parasitica EP155]